MNCNAFFGKGTKWHMHARVKKVNQLIYADFVKRTRGIIIKRSCSVSKIKNMFIVYLSATCNDTWHRITVFLFAHCIHSGNKYNIIKSFVLNEVIPVNKWIQKVHISVNADFTTKSPE